MTTERSLADVLQKCCEAKKTGMLLIFVAAASEHLIRIYFKNGEIFHLLFGPAKDGDCLDILDCYDFHRAIFFEGMKAFTVPSGLPKTADIIDRIGSKDKKVLVDHSNLDCRT